MTLEYLFDRYLTACVRLSESGCQPVLEMDVSTVCLLIATLQLALRHPDFPSTSAAIVRSMIDRMIATLESQEPDIGAFLRLGHEIAVEQEG